MTQDTSPLRAKSGFKLYQLILLGAVVLCGALWVIDLWFDVLDADMMGKLFSTTFFVGLYAATMAAIEQDASAGRFMWLWRAVGVLATLTVILLTGQIWLAWLDPDIMAKLLLTLVTAAGLLGAGVALGGGLGREKDLRDNDFID